MCAKIFDRNTTADQVLQGVELNGKTVLITGANDGIGLETARALASHNAHVVMACRDVKSAETAKASIIERHKDAKIDVIYLDLSKLVTVECCALQYLSKQWPLHILILNAGVYDPQEKITVDELEHTFQVNCLAHFFLVQLLQPVIVKNVPARIVIVSSEAHKLGKLDSSMINRNVLSPINPKDVPSSVTTYGRSKFCNILFANELHRRWKDAGVITMVLHPGIVQTKMIQNAGLAGWARSIMRWMFVGSEPTVTPDKGAATSVYCATAQECIGGKYYRECQVASCDPSALDENASKALWSFCEELVQKWRERPMN